MLFLVAIFSLLSFTVHADNNKDNYLDLMKKCLMNSIYQDSGHNGNTYQSEVRENGRDWPSTAHTMIGLHRLNNLQDCVEDVLKNNIEGDLIETGVWRGGASIFMRAILKAYDNTEKKVFVADSFEGLPVANVALYPIDASIGFLADCKILAVSLPQVQSNFARYGLLDNQVVFLKGWFCDTLPTAPIERLAIMRLDGDYYESTMDALISLYPKLSVGGYVIIDDYWIPCCAQAVHDFRRTFNITDEIIKTKDLQGAFWKRTK
ncbi:MAG: TylF/MycF family methyltransferase [Candidatus Babeliales bacterium]|jgi:hypothetical protein